MPVDGTIELVSNEQQPSSDLTQSNNGNDRSLTSTGVGAQENFIPIILLFEMVARILGVVARILARILGVVARILGVVACGWVLLVLVQGGMVGTLETKDLVFVTMLFFLVFFRCWRHYCPEAYRSFTDATQSLSADYLSIPNDIQQLAQQLALPSCCIRRLFYCSSLVSAMTSVVLSIMRLASQDFGKKEVENKESRDFALKVFYGLTLVEALVLLFAEALSSPIKWNSVGLANGPRDDLEVGLRTRGNSVGLANGPGDGLEVELITRGNSVGLADGLGDGPEDGPGDGSGDVPVNQSNEVAQMDRPANQSNDFNLEGPADSLPNLQQRQREIWRSQVKVGSTGGVEGSLDDGHSWRKYGQKITPGAKHPRGYYRCSQGCQALKQVQRTDDNPTVFDVIYIGTHTCIDFNSEGPADSLPNLRQRRRKIPQWRSHVKVEDPLDDGHSWRKYGQKKILGAKHPRNYYRCTSQGCQAKKRVQRTDDNSTVFDVIYLGTHTCILTE